MTEAKSSIIQKCPECKKEVGKNTKRCEHCGYDIEKNQRWVSNIFGVVGLLGMINVFFAGGYLKIIFFILGIVNLAISVIIKPKK